MVSTFKIDLKKTDVATAEATTDKFKMVIDEPVSMGGHDSAMNPQEILLSALAACQTFTTCKVAAQRGINIEEISLEVEGDVDKSLRPGFFDIRRKFHIRSDATQEELKDLLVEVDATCGVADTLMNGVRFEVPEIEK